jgi:hypothetical protein
MDWVLSITSCLMLWLMGNRSKWGPRVGILNQALWIIYAISIDQVGLLLGVLAYTVIHIRNCFKWERVA